MRKVLSFIAAQLGFALERVGAVHEDAAIIETLDTWCFVVALDAVAGYSQAKPQRCV